MNLLKALKRIKPKRFGELVFLGFSRPLFVIPTFRATKTCMAVSTEHYGRLHYKNGQANAFRHAFWNYLIAKKCFRFGRNLETVLQWAKKITDWHENAFRNRELARKMDLHNNEVGRWVFKTHFSKLENQVVTILREMAEKAIKIDPQTDFSSLENQLVYIIEDHER